MIQNLYKQERQKSIIGKSLQFYPNVVVTMPFEPLVVPKALLEDKLKRIMNNVERELSTYFPENMAKDIWGKLKSIIVGLNYISHRKSIVIHVSAVTAKVYYLNAAVNEMVAVGKPFSIRNIIYNKKEEKKYLLLVLTGESTRIYLGDSNHLKLNVINLPEQIAAYTTYGLSENDNSETFLQKFIKHADDALNVLLNYYALPLFVMTTPIEKMQFLHVSKNSNNVIEYVDIESDDITEKEILSQLQPFIKDWEKVKEKYMLHQIEQAIYAKKLVAGIEVVNKAARESKSKLLVIERNYMFTSYFEDEEIAHMENILSNDLKIKNAVEDTIENVLKDGGEVEFVEEGILSDYLHIALIKD